ncbi:MAG: hypothetical protein KDI09_16215 [Halioglobus sp.]|nr:hypothetical protein [Halioglobus sp.]
MQSKLAWLVHTGGCETGPAVPEPGNHNIVYVSCKGRFGVFDKRTGQEKGYYLGAANMYGHNPKDLRYRFQRVSPVHVSPHNPGVVYQGSQYLHPTSDDGVTWETISPDLTANEADKQVISGSPITRDITGEEFYSTLYAIRESAVQAGVIWTGANDGPVYVSRDNGENWRNVTPRMPKGGRVDSVEPSPHDAATAYVTVLRYQLADWKPYVYKTDNYGERWTLLTNGSNGIPEDYPVRVVREDPVRPGLLYAGTEYGMFVSLDDGANWLPFQQNLPVTPVTDIKVYRGDLAISTMGRGFWILDNVTTLRQAAFDLRDDALVLFQPKDSYRYRSAYSDNSGVPDYPRPSVLIDYYLPAEAAGTVQLDILDMAGNVVNSYRNATDDQQAEAAESRDMARNEIDYVVDETLSAKKGLNRFRWDMTHRGAWHKDAKRSYRNGPMAAPGRYRVRLTVGDRGAEHGFELRADPRVLEFGTSLADMEQQVALELQIQELLSDARRLEDRLSQEKETLTKARDNGAMNATQEARFDSVKVALELLTTAKGTYMQPMLIDQIEYLYGMLDDADQAPGGEAIERFDALKSEMDKVRNIL